MSGPAVTIAQLERRIIELEEALVAVDAVSAGEAISYEDACRHGAVVLSAMDAVRARSGAAGNSMQPSEPAIMKHSKVWTMTTDACEHCGAHSVRYTDFGEYGDTKWHCDGCGRDWNVAGDDA